MTKSKLKSTVPLMVLGLFVSGCASFSYSDVRPVSEMPGDPSAAEQADLAAGLDAYAQGKDHLKHDRVALALQAFRQDIFDNGETVKNLNGMGVAYDQLQRYDVSQRYFDRALALEPKSTETLNNMAASLIRQGRSGEAQKVLARIENTKLDTQVASVVDMQKRLAASMSEHLAQRLAKVDAGWALPKTGYEPKMKVEKVAASTWQLAVASRPAASKQPSVSNQRDGLAPRLREILVRYDGKLAALEEGADETPGQNRAQTPVQAHASVLPAAVSVVALRSLVVASLQSTEKSEQVAQASVHALGEKHPVLQSVDLGPRIERRADRLAAAGSRADYRLAAILPHPPKLNYGARYQVPVRAARWQSRAFHPVLATETPKKPVLDMVTQAQCRICAEPYLEIPGILRD